MLLNTNMVKLRDIGLSFTRLLKITTGYPRSASGCLTFKYKFTYWHDVHTQDNIPHSHTQNGFRLPISWHLRPISKQLSVSFPVPILCELWRIIPLGPTNFRYLGYHPHVSLWWPGTKQALLTHSHNDYSPGMLVDISPFSQAISCPILGTNHKTVERWNRNPIALVFHIPILPNKAQSLLTF